MDFLSGASLPVMLLVAFVITAFLAEVKCNLSVVLIYIAMIAEDVENLLQWFIVWELFYLSVYWLDNLLSWYVVSYIFMYSWCHSFVQCVVSRGFLLSWRLSRHWIVSFAVWKGFNLMQSYLTLLSFISKLWELFSEGPSPCW